jgi:hypothetical protein
MSIWRFWRWRRKPRTIRLLVMRAADMFVAHPNTNYSHVCSQCGEMVGIYPAGLRLLQERQGVVLVCNRCSPAVGSLVPGARDDIPHSRPVRRIDL